MAKQKNQHYVPQIYLRNFSLDGSTIGVYVKEKGIWIDRAPIKNQSCADYFYGKDLFLENRFSSLEGKTAELFNRFNQGDFNLNIDDKETLYFYVMLQYGRTEMVAKQLQDLSKNVQTRIESTFTNHSCPKISAGETLLNSVKLSLELASRYYDTILDLDYKIISNCTSKDFITSDNPICLYNQFCEKISKPSFAFGSIGTQIFFTLNPRLMLAIYDASCYRMGKQKERIIKINNIRDLYALNDIVYINANKVIYFQDKGKVCVRPKEINHNYVTPQIVSHIQNPNNYSVIYLSNRPPLCNAQLSFVKLFSRYNSVPEYDYSMGGLLRSICALNK